MLDKSNIVQLLHTNDRAVARALVALTNRQTADEQASQNTHYRNGRGFRPCHARMGTSMAKFYEDNGYLSPAQLSYWREPQRDGRSRIEIYARQLLDIARTRPAPRPEPQMIEARIVEPEQYPVRYEMERSLDTINEPMYNSDIQAIFHQMDQLKHEIESYSA